MTQSTSSSRKSSRLSSAQWMSSNDEDERALLGEAFEEAPPGGERLVAPVAAELRLAAEAEEREQVRLDPRLVARAGERVLDGLVDLGRDVVERVLLEDARLRLDDLAERPERDPVAVGEAAALAPGDELGVGLDDAVAARRRGGSCRCRGRRRA